MATTQHSPATPAEKHPTTDFLQGDDDTRMSNAEKRSTISLAAIMSFRMLGLFMILPIFSVYAQELRHTTPALIGIALGVYGLTQALLQTPFGMLSDRYGRKPIITLGLVIFILGSIIAALSDSIYGVILGRSLQGAGAVGATIIALVADLTRDEHRTKAMALIGMTIGLSFGIALVIGPILNSLFNAQSLFWSTALLGAGGIFMLHYAVPNPQNSRFHLDCEAEPTEFLQLLKHPQLLRLDVGILIQHAILMAIFIAIPIALQNIGQIKENQLWHLYLPALTIAFAAMVPFIVVSEKKRLVKPFFIGAIFVILLSQIGLLFSYHHIIGIALFLTVFFAAFSFLEACLPSLISRVSPTERKGTAMGIYSSFQFLGIFIGGSLGGLLYGYKQISGIFAFCIIMALIWLIIAFKMKQPPYLSSKILHIGSLSSEKAQALKLQLLAVEGVIEVNMVIAEKVAYLKVDKAILKPAELAPFSQHKKTGDTK